MHGIDTKNYPFRYLNPSDRAVTLWGEMAEKKHLRRSTRLHEHTAVVTHAVGQRAGIPYEIEQRVCSDCRSVLEERKLRRAAA